MLLTSVLPADAQTISDNTADMTRRISQIKRDTTFLYGDATMKTASEATDGAKAILEMTVVDWVRAQHPAEGVELCVAKAKEHCELVQTRRGTYHRSFIYVSKADILPLVNSGEMMVIRMDSIPTPSVQLSSPKDNPDTDNTNDAPSEAIDEITPLEQQMTAITSFYNVEPFVQQLRQQGRLVAYGKYATLPADSACHLFIYDQEAQVRAVLRRNAQGELINLRTMQPDAISNYRQCGAIWVRMKEIETE